jgi:hypothetical protein
MAGGTWCAPGADRRRVVRDQHAVGPAVGLGRRRVYDGSAALRRCCARWCTVAPTRRARGPRLTQRHPTVARHGGRRSCYRPGCACLGPPAHEWHQCVAHADAGSAVHSDLGMAAIPRNHGPSRVGGNAPAARGRGRLDSRSVARQWCPPVGPVGGPSRDRGMGARQHLVATACRTGPGPGRGRQGRCGSRRNVVPGICFRRALAGCLRGARIVRRRCYRLWSEPSFLSLGATSVWSCAYGVRIRVCSFYRRGPRRGPGRPFRELDDGGGRCSDACRRDIAPCGVTLPRASA